MRFLVPIVTFTGSHLFFNHSLLSRERGVAVHLSRPLVSVLELYVGTQSEPETRDAHLQTYCTAARWHFGDALQK